jgi:4-hydroxy-2,2'-bipyrrole-5-carbaldehyde O-methyltransferase
VNIRYLLSFWRTVKMPGLLPVMRDWQSSLRLHFLYAAFESGLIEALQTGADRDALVNMLQVQRPELLDALLDMGLALKELSLTNGVFGLKGKRSKVLATPKGDFLAAMIQADVTYYNSAYRHLAARMRGASLGDDLDEIGETVARFSKFGEPILKNFIKSMVPASGSFRVLDVGCGSGFVLKTAWQANHTVTGLGIDADERVVNQARGNLEKWGLTNQFSILSGDIRSHDLVQQGGFDLITAFNVIYYVPFDERPEFFALLRSLLARGGRLGLVNTFQSRGIDPAAANLNIVNCSLKQLTTLPALEDIETQLAGCHFDRIKATRFMPRSEFYGISAIAS